MKKIFLMGWLVLLLTLGCTGGEEPAVDSVEGGDDPGQTAVVQNENQDEDNETDSGEENQTESNQLGSDDSTETAADEMNEGDEASVEEPQADEAQSADGETSDNMVLEVFEVPVGGFTFAAPMGYDVTIEAEEAQLAAKNGDPDHGPEFFVAGGPLDGITTELMAGFMLTSLAETQGFEVGELSEVTINGLSGYAAPYSGTDDVVTLEGQLIVLGNDIQAVMIFGGGPADVWTQSAAAEFEQLANSINLMALAEDTTEEAQSKDDKPAATAGGEAIVIDADAAGMACVSTADAAVSCVSPAGEWVAYDDENSPLGGNRVSAMAACPDGTILMAHLFGISAFDGTDWREYGDDWGSGSVDGIACAPNGDIWIAHFRGASKFDGSGWTTYGSELLEGVDDPGGLVDDIAVGSDGTVWVVTSNTIASHAGDGWTVYDEAALGDLYFFEAITVGPDDLPRAFYGDGVLTFDGSAWTGTEGSFYSAQDGALDSDGNVWIGTFQDGLYQLSGGSWAYEGVDTGLSSNRINAVEIDDAGRIWVGTDYGLNVFDGSQWRVYRMDNSDLVDNEISTVLVVGAGPQLPETAAEPAGTMTGSLTLDGEPFVGTRVEICVEALHSFYDGATPCSDQQVYFSTETADDGSFTLADVPEGYYVITAETTDGWAQLTTEYGFGSERVPVYAGEETDIGELMITTDDS